jgi:hypothetical protein
MVFLSVGVLSFAPAVFAGGEERVVATYYHGTIRCFECLEIERFSRQTLEERFAEQLAAGKLEWRAVDYDRPENAAAIERYNLSALSLVISRYQGGRELEWRVAGETWKQIAAYPEALMDYVEEELGEMTFGGEWDEDPADED